MHSKDVQQNAQGGLMYGDCESFDVRLLDTSGRIIGACRSPGAGGIACLEGGDNTDTVLFVRSEKSIAVMRALMQDH